MTVRVFAPAKINLTLEVGALKANGRHDLQSVVAFADVGDWLEAQPARGLSLGIDGPFAPGLVGEQDNLVLRAARALAEAGGLDAASAALQLTKNLPIASGIGGGSSDAAAALKALNALWSLELSPQRLMQIGATLGGDVPVCVLAESAYMTGEGETAAPAPLPLLNAVLVNPGVAVSTRDVFRRFDAMQGGADFTPAEAPRWSGLSEVCAGIAARGNQLAAAARAIAPVIAEVEAVLNADVETRCVSLSGSGATVFAITETKQAAQDVAARLRAGFPNWWVSPTTLALDPRPGPPIAASIAR